MEIQLLKFYKYVKIVVQKCYNLVEKKNDITKEGGAV